MHDVILAQSQPREVRVSEEYVYDEKISGVRSSKMVDAKGRITVTIPYYGRGDVEEGGRRLTSSHSFGHLYVREYGLSRLNREPIPSLDQNRLWLRLNSDSREFEQIREFRSASFDIRLIQEYTPEAPTVKPLEIEVELLDEDEARDKKTWAKALQRWESHGSESVEEMLVQQTKELISFRRSLIFRFRLSLRIPARMAPDADDKLKVERVALAWPIATSPRLARVQGNPDAAWTREAIEQAQSQLAQAQLAQAQLAQSRDEEREVEGDGGPFGDNGEGVVSAREEGRGGREWPIVHDPENGVIEWYDVPFHPIDVDGEQDIRVYQTDPFQLEVDHPGKLYTEGPLEGSVTIRLRGARSGLELQYVGPSPVDLTRVPVAYETTVVNTFHLHPEENFEQRFFSPQQHLQFPGIVLDHTRVADVLMLLRDQRFELKREEWLRRVSDGDGVISQHLIEAQRPEGTGQLHLWLLIQGTPATTERERQTLGEAKYTTELDTGRTVIYMRGRLRGDSQRVVAVMNELQAQLKEHFRHVGTVD